MRVVVPFAVDSPKTRLSGVLNPEERRAFAHTMLEDVLSVLRKTEHDPEILATAALDAEVPVTVDDRPLTTAVNVVLEQANDTVAIVMADLPLVTPAAFDRFVETVGDVVIAPGHGGGTNALLVRDTSFRVDYHGLSFRDHVAAGQDIGAAVGVVDSHRLATDVDDPSDLLEVLVHGTGEAPDWLANAGFEVSTDGDRPRLERCPDRAD